MIQRLFDRIRAGTPDGLAKASSWGLFDQAVISGTNFATMIIAARLLGPAAFGAFAFALTVLSFMESTQRSIVTTPHNVLGASRSGESYREYTTSALTIQAGMTLLFTLLIAVAGIVLLAFLSATAGRVAIAAALAVLGWQVHEFCRRVLYTELRVATAFAVDALAYVSRFPLIALVVMAGGLTGPRLLLVFAATWGAGGLLGIWTIRYSFRFRLDMGAVRENWQFGSWLLAGNVFAFLPRYVVAGLLSAVLSVAAFGAYRAFEQLSNAANVPITALSNVLRPRLAREARNGPGAVWKLMLPFMILGSIALGLFAGVLILFHAPVIELIFGPEYTQFSAALFLVALVPLALIQKSMLIKALQAFRNTRTVFVGTAIGGVAGSVLGSAAIISFGLPAAGSVMLISALITVCWLAWAWSTYLADEEQWHSNLPRAAKQTIND